MFDAIREAYTLFGGKADLALNGNTVAGFFFEDGATTGRACPESS
jgi:hypothetical protein